MPTGLSHYFNSNSHFNLNNHQRTHNYSEVLHQILAKFESCVCNNWLFSATIEHSNQCNITGLSFCFSPVSPTVQPKCALSTGYTNVNIRLLSYTNQLSLQQDGKTCDGASALCNILVAVCVSPLGKRWVITLFKCVKYNKTPIIFHTTVISGNKSRNLYIARELHETVQLLTYY